MDEQLALRLLRRIMEWGEEKATEEYRWVRLISQLKYDGYGDYMAGVRFAESLAGWLVQFKPSDRQAAYEFVKNRLTYFTGAEINRLVIELQPRFVEPILRIAAGKSCSVPAYLAAADPSANSELKRLRRRTLYIGLSDGARIDVLRRANSGTLVNDQIVLATHIDDDKWEDLRKNLEKHLDKLGGGEAKFCNVFLIDDFAASGTTFIRRQNDKWSGKLYKFYRSVAETRSRFASEGRVFPLHDDVAIRVHHYISTTRARDTIKERLAAIKKEETNWFSCVDVSEGLLLPAGVAIDQVRDADVWRLTEDYYDHDIWQQLKEHLSPDQKDLKRGYADCGLPVALEHNCPNNAITLLWAETKGIDGAHPMRPLFPRRHRHS